MRITSYDRCGGRPLDRFNLTMPDLCPYLPIHAVYFSHAIDGDHYFSKPNFSEAIPKSNTLNNIKMGLEESLTPLKISVNSNTFYFVKGAMYDALYNPLLMLASKEHKFVSHDERFENFSYNNYVLFYSTSFFTNPNLKALDRRLQKEILLSCYEKGIEVRLVTSQEIERNTFTRLFEVKKTSSINQLDMYMKAVLPNFIYTGNEDYPEEQKRVIPAPISVPQTLSLEEEALLFDAGASINIEELLREERREEIENYIAQQRTTHIETAVINSTILAERDTWRLVDDLQN